MKRAYLALLSTMTVIAVSAQEMPPPLHTEAQPGIAQEEFLFSEIEGVKRGGPQSFLRNHAAQQAIPGPVNLALRAALASKAWKAFDQVRFRGKSRGRQGVWQLLGPVTESDPGRLGPKNSTGRVSEVLAGASCNDDKCRLYVGTAGGGVWRTDKALHPDNPGWEHLSNGLPSNNIGSLSADTNDTTAMTFYVGTGESNFSFTSAAGLGVFKTTDGGDSFSKLPTMITDLDVQPGPIDFTHTRGVTRVAVKPGDPDTIYVATATAMIGMTAVRGGQSTITGGPQPKVGLYKTTDGGASWTQVFDVPIDAFSSDGTHEGIYQQISGIKDVQLDPQDPQTVYVSVADDGLYRASMSLDGDTVFRKVFEIVGIPHTDSYAAFDLTIKDGKTRIYLYNGNGVLRFLQDFYRVEDSRVPAASLFTAGVNTAAWVNMTNPSAHPRDLTEWSLCNGQCVYDLVVKVPDGRPDTVYLGGQVPSVAARPMVRSTDGGENFDMFGVDIQPQPGLPHVDVRSFAFSPDNPDIVFTGSDGGVVRNDGLFVDGTHLCDTLLFFPGSFRDIACQESAKSIPNAFIFMNRGLAAMQLYNISADPATPLKRLMTGTQDNSTQMHDGTQSVKNWSKVFGIGDGTSANGFHRENPDILFASFQSNSFFTHFNRGIGGDASWYHTGGPIKFSGVDAVFYPNQPPGSGRQFITFDPLDADTQFTGYEHVWRTQNNGGAEADLAANGCLLNDGWGKVECGDWVPLGDYLTRANFGTDRSGGVISTAERSAADGGTLWAGTSLGRLFITSNADQGDHTLVDFTRLDTADTPPRFVSGIAVDHADPNRAFVSYSGFSAVTPGEPGHVFEAVYDPNAGTTTFSSMDFDLPDMPVNHIARDDLTGDLYVANDFGVMVLPAGGSSWEIAAAGMPPVLTPHLEIHSQARLLFAATHGLGAWFMNLPKLKKGTGKP